MQSTSSRVAIPPPIVEVEVDTLEQLKLVLPAGPDIVLLDNMSPDTLRLARNTLVWEAGGVTYRLESALGRVEAVWLAESID